MLAYLIAAHLVGDFLLQNEYMQAKAKCPWTCTYHVLMYSIPFLLLIYLDRLSIPMLELILFQHWFQDRYSWHLKWMEFFKQTPVQKWPVGPLCVDQAMHIGFMWLLSLRYT